LVGESDEGESTSEGEELVIQIALNLRELPDLQKRISDIRVFVNDQIAYLSGFAVVDDGLQVSIQLSRGRVAGRPQHLSVSGIVSTVEFLLCSIVHDWNATAHQQEGQSGLVVDNVGVQVEPSWVVMVVDEGADSVGVSKTFEYLMTFYKQTAVEQPLPSVLLLT